MPELPEVETALRGIKPHVLTQQITQVIVRHYGLRWPVPADIATIVRGQTLTGLVRRGKYLLLEMTESALILHLGMSGSLRVLPAATPPNKHDHVDIVFANQTCLRFTDPRRFGAVLWCDDPSTHPLLVHLGPEPLTAAFHSKYLHQQANQRKTPVKTFIMDSRVVVGVGNIYANEALFAAGIHPQQPAGEVTLTQYNALVTAIKTVLRAAIRQGGTTLKDFVQSDGKKGYFKVHLQVYGRGAAPCLVCQTPLTEIRLGQRTTVYCSRCQKR